MKSSGEHRRGRSMGSVIPLPAATRAGEKDEDLALFHEMKRREKHNFLHPSPDDLDATLSSKFGGMGAPTKKPGTDLLTSESDKNDYDWLLTPPGTPLFPSLDQEAAALAVLSPALSNGSYSSASSATKSLKSAYSPAESVSKVGSRGNPSPRRQGSTGSTTPNGISRSRSSPSTAATLTRPSTPTFDTGTRPSTPTAKSSSPSVRASTPNLKLTISHSSKSYSTATTPTGTRPSTPTPRSSTPPVRPSTPGGRSSTPTSKPSTPTMRRSLSGGRTGLTSPSISTTRGGPSPKRNTSSSRGNSPSAKRVTSVITSIAGMSSEAPPNLRTTMSERPSSAGKSNGSRQGSESAHMEDSAQSRRRPRSPSIARSFSSSSSQDQRTTSSQTSRGSVISSYDDGLEVNRPSSITGSSRSSSVGNKWHAAGHEELLGGKGNAFAKRVTKPSVPSKETSGFGVAPAKKSSDPVKRPVDAYQNSPTTAYRHLHSSSPGSPFYSTRSNSLLPRTGSAMNSSVTTSSNASSEHGTTVAADTEGSERDEDDLLSWDSYGRRASTSPRLQQADILVLDKDDEKAGLWQDSLYDRANSNEPSSSHSQGSQSTLDAEVTGFFETDGIASLEMLEQLGLMGESYKLKKSSTFGGRSSEKRANSSTEDNNKVSRLRADEVGNSKFSPHGVFQEGQGTPTRYASHLERQENSEHTPPRKSRDFETELLKRNGEKSLGLPEPKVHSSEIRAACLFVRDFKVGPSPPRTQHSPLFAKDSSPGGRKHGIDEMEMKLRNELSYDWDNTVDSVDAKGGIESKLSDSPILDPRPKQNVATSLDLSPRLNLENPSNPVTAAYDDAKVKETSSKHEGLTAMRKSDLTLPKNVHLGHHPMSMNGVPSNAVIDSSFCNNGVMDESETESIPARDVGCSLPLEDSGARNDSAFVLKKAANLDTSLVTSKLLNVQSDLSDDGVYAMDEDVPEINVAGNSAVQNRSQESELMESTEGRHVHVKEERDNSPMDVNEVSTTSVREKYVGETHGKSNEMEVLPAQNLLEVAGGMDRSLYAKADDQPDVTDEGFPAVHYSEADNEQDVAEEKLDRMWSSEADGQEHITDNGLKVIPVSVGESGEGVAEDLLVHEKDEHAIIPVVNDALQDSGVEIQQGPHVHSNGNHDLVESKCPSIVEKEAVPMHDVEGVLQSSTDEEQIPQKLLGHSDKESAKGVQESLPGMLHVYSAVLNHDMEGVLLSSTRENQSPQTLLGRLDNGSAENGKESLAGISHVDSAVPSHAMEAVLPSSTEEERSPRKPLGNSDKEYAENGKESSPGTHVFSAVPKHDMEAVMWRTDEERSSPKLREHSDKESAEGVKESSPMIPHVYSDERDGNQEFALHKNLKTAGSDGLPMDMLRSSASWEGAQNPEVEPLAVSTAGVTVEGAGACLSEHQVQEESQSLEYFDADSAAAMDNAVDDAGEEVSSGPNNHPLQEDLESLRDGNVDSVKEFDFLQDASPEEDLLHNPPFSTQQAEDPPLNSIDVAEKELPEFTSWSYENRQLSNGRVNDSKIGPNCKTKSPQLFEKHIEVLDLPHRAEEVSEAQPPKPEFRSASTLCAALEEQIAGLIQKIDSAIEESSKPFNSSPQESLLVKEKHTTLSSELARELEQDDCMGSIRPSQEEDLLDMLWAEDDESSCSDGSRDQDFLNSKDGSQREMNDVRSSRLSDRGLPASLLGGQSNDAYDAVLRSSRSDLGVEKYIPEELSSKRSTAALADQQEDVFQIHTRDPAGSPLLRSTNTTPQDVSVHDLVPEDDTHSHLDTHFKIESSSTDTIPNGKVGGDGLHLQTYEDLHPVSCAQEYSSESLTESSSGDDEGDDVKTDEELFSLYRLGQEGRGLDNQTKPSVDLGSLNTEAGPPAADKVSFAEERWEENSANLAESTQEARESSEASPISSPHKDVILRDQDMSVIPSNGNGETVEARDLAIQEVAHNRDRDESPILLTLARSDASSRAANEAPNEEWLHRKSKLPEEEPSTRPVKTVDYVPQLVPEGELFEMEPQSIKEKEVEQDAFHSPSHSLMSKPVDISNQEEPPKVEEEEMVQGQSTIYSNCDSPLRDVGSKFAQESERIHIHQECLSPQHEVSLGVGAEEGDSSSGIEKQKKVTFDVHGSTKSNVMESTHLPDSNSAGHSDQNMRTDADGYCGGEDLFTLVEESEQVSSQRDHISPNESESHTDGMRYEGVQERRMPEEHAESSPVSLLNGESEEARIQKWKSKERQKDSQQGQHISLIAGNKMSRPDRESFRLEENESVAELDREPGSVASDMMPVTTIVRENGSMGAHASNEVEPLKEQNHIREDPSAEGPVSGHPEVTRLSVWSELPAVDLYARRPAVGKEEMKVSSDEYSSGANGNEDFGSRQDLVKRLPINKAKSVRTISLSTLAQSESPSPSEEPGSPDGPVGVHTPQKSNAFASITVISPEKLQWEHNSSSAEETPTKTRGSPASLSRSMTLAEATDTILYCSSLMHTIVYKAAAYAIEKEELAALASTPTSNGEVPHVPSEVDSREETDSGVGEAEKHKVQGLSTGPPARRALSYMGHQTVPVTPTDTSLQIPVDQVIGSAKSPQNTAETAIQIDEKDVVMPVKVTKSKCGCSIM